MLRIISIALWWQSQWYRVKWWILSRKYEEDYAIMLVQFGDHLSPIACSMHDLQCWMHLWYTDKWMSSLRFCINISKGEPTPHPKDTLFHYWRNHAIRKHLILFSEICFFTLILLLFSEVAENKSAWQPFIYAKTWSHPSWHQSDKLVPVSENWGC